MTTTEPVADPWSTPERRHCGSWPATSCAGRSRRTSPSGRRPGSCRASLHKTFADAGLLGVAFPEAVGGGGGDAIDAAIVAEELMLGGGSGGVVASLFTHGIALPHIVAAGYAGPDRPLRPARRWPAS